MSDFTPTTVAPSPDVAPGAVDESKSFPTVGVKPKKPQPSFTSGYGSIHPRD